MFTAAGFAAASLYHWVTIVTKRTSLKTTVKRRHLLSVGLVFFITVPGMEQRCSSDGHDDLSQWAPTYPRLHKHSLTPDPMSRQATAKLQTHRRRSRRRRRSRLVPGGGARTGLAPLLHVTSVITLLAAVAAVARRVELTVLWATVIP